MSDLLTTSVTGMIAFQRAMDVTGHNIANANTPGYSRQVAEFATMPGQGSGNGFIGSGVQISTIRRIYDSLLATQLQEASSGQGRLDVMSSLASQLDGLLANPDTGFSPALQSFFNSVQDVANDPASLSAREALLGEADGLVQRVQGIDQRLRQIDDEVNGRIRQSIEDINRIAGSIASVNDRIVLAQGRTGQPPNDLLDQRDGLIRQLSAEISLTTVPQDDGSLNVFVGSGQTLVIGNQSRSLGVRPNEYEPTRLEVVYRDLGSDAPLGTGLTGGSLGGLLEFRSQVLDVARNSLGKTALAMATAFNDQHARGMDLRGQLGGEFFGLNPPTVRESAGNTGTATVTADIADLGALTGGEYLLDYDGVTYSLRDATSNQAIAMTGSGTVADPFVADGVSIVVSGAAAAGDQFLVRPTRDTVSGLRVSAPDSQSVAMAAPTRTRTGDANLGDATITQTEIIDYTDPNLTNTSVISFINATTYSINGAGSFAYTSGDPITINGSRFTIAGTPEAGDEFTVEANLGGSGDNRNGLLLSSVQSNGILDGGTASINDNYGQLVTDVGAAANQIDANLSAQNVILASIEDTISSKSGVNLDEEAAKLLRFQQAYQAAAQVVSVTSTLFDTLIAAVRR